MADNNTEKTNVPQKKKAPMSVNERKRKSRQKQKDADPFYKMKENERIKNLKQLRDSHSSARDIEKRKKQNRDRVRKFRLKQKEAKAPEYRVNGVGFKSPQSLGKAIKRIKEKFPNSPTKKIQAINGLAKEQGLKLIDKMNQSVGKNVRSLPEEDIDEIKEFFINSDIVYTAPGLKDEVTVWEDGEKKKN